MRYACVTCGLPSAQRRCPQHRLSPRPRGKAFEPTRQRILDRDGWKCQECGVELTDVPNRPNSAHVGHRISRANQGSDNDSNLYASCAECNLKRGAA